jgi:hypothetical protein
VRVHILNTSKIILSMRLQTLITRFWFKLTLGCIIFPCLVHVAKHAYFGKKCHLCLRLPFLQLKISLHWHMCDIMWSLLLSFVFIYVMCITKWRVWSQLAINIWIPQHSRWEEITFTIGSNIIENFGNKSLAMPNFHCCLLHLWKK